MNKIEYIDECKRIQSTLLGHWRIEATLSECQGLWRIYCRDQYCTNKWVPIPEEQLELTDALRDIIRELRWTWDGPYAVPGGPL